jgi:hypothetical protein
MPSLLNENQKTNKLTGMFCFDSNELTSFLWPYLEKCFQIRIGNCEEDGTYISHHKYCIPFYYVYIILLLPSQILSTLILL